MAGTTWKLIARDLAVALEDDAHQCDHGMLTPACAACGDRHALMLHRDAAIQDQVKPYKPLAWREIAKKLATRIRGTAVPDGCAEHAIASKDCSRCTSTATLGRYEDMAYASGVITRAGRDRRAAAAGRR